MAILFTAFLLGLMGSLHCVGMCGPIALSLPLRGDTIVQKIWGSTLWSLGRILTYSIMGVLFGLIGSGFKMLGYQQIISILIGSLMILSVFLPSLFKKFAFGRITALFNPLRKGLQQLLKEKNNRALFLIGLFNGLLPCGLVYMAVAGAIATSDVFYAMLFMALFGLGTLPLLLLVSLLGNVISLSIRKTINKVVPVVVIALGIIFILRGLTLGIPYLSPPAEKLSPATQMSIQNTPVEKALKNACCQQDTLIKQQDTVQKK
jgi:sulfite exporter TauE/SafE